MKTILRALMLTAAASFSLETFAAKIGDPAAPLQIKEWVKGSAVDVKDGKGVYVVEFWATWCGPCKTTIPHLTEMQKKFKSKGVTFIGVSDEEPSKVKPFVTKMGDKMDYVVACDKGSKTSEGYMEAYGQGGIPTAFVVNKEGKVVWVGHPMDGLEQTIQKVIDGKFDLPAAIRKGETRSLMEEYQKMAVAGDAQTKATGEKVVAALGTDVDELCSFAFSIVANGQVKNRDFVLADSTLDIAEKNSSKDDHRVLGVRSISLFESGKKSEGLKMAQAAVASAKEPEMKERYGQFVKVMQSRLDAEKQAAK